MPAPIITMLSDFGSRDAYVGIMKGVVLGIAPDAQLIDLTHEIPPQDILAGAHVLRSAVPYFPDGTVHLAVVDPGVGGARAPLAIATQRAILVGPDNGLLSLAAERLGIASARRIDAETLLRQPISSTFHGRDIFAPVAAHLARGARFDAVGAEHPEFVRIADPRPVHRDGAVFGAVVYVDGFGNLVTNITAEDIARCGAAAARVHIGTNPAGAIQPSYASVECGALVALIGSWGALEIAVRDGSAAAVLGLNTGAAVRVEVA